jgi:BolA protein
MNMTFSIQPALIAALQSAFTPTLLEVLDVSAGHLGHAGYKEGGNTHWQIKIISNGFTGKKKVEQHRMVYAAVQPWMDNPIHALQLTLGTPEHIQS